MSTTHPDLDTVRVLIVEDDPNNLMVISRLLKLTGVKPENTWGYPGDPARFFVDNPAGVDLIFLDIQLPKKDGYAIIGELRENPRSQKAIIIAITANVMKQDIKRAREAGFDGFIGKPIDGRRFSETVKKILSGEKVWTIQ